MDFLDDLSNVVLHVTLQVSDNCPSRHTQLIRSAIRVTRLPAGISYMYWPQLLLLKPNLLGLIHANIDYWIVNVVLGLKNCTGMYPTQQFSPILIDLLLSQTLWNSGFRCGINLIVLLQLLLLSIYSYNLFINQWMISKWCYCLMWYEPYIYILVQLVILTQKVIFSMTGINVVVICIDISYLDTGY